MLYTLLIGGVWLMLHTLLIGVWLMLYTLLIGRCGLCYIHY